MTLQRTFSNLTTADFAFAGITSGAAGGAVSFLVSHGLMGPLVSFLLFVLTTAVRAALNARTRRGASHQAPTLLSPEQVAQLIEEMQRRGALSADGAEGTRPPQGLDGRGQLAAMIQEKVDGQE